MTQEELRPTVLHDCHMALEAKMGQEGDCLVPLSYGNALGEVGQTRQRAGVIDMSHTVRIRFRGDHALDLLERICTHDVAHQQDDSLAQSLLCNERGGIIAEIELLRLESSWLMTSSAGNRASLLEYVQLQGAGMNVKIEDLTLKQARIDVLGPQAKELLDAVLPFKVSDLKNGGVKEGSMLLVKYIAARSDMGGLWGAQVYLPELLAAKAWNFITHKAGDRAIKPLGLAALDVLRIEEGIVRYGHEINQTIDPVTARLENMLHMGHEFVGREALLQLQQRRPARVRVGLLLESSNRLAAAKEIKDSIFLFDLQDIIPRQGAAILDSAGSEIGVVTSGTYSPTMSSAIAMGYISASAAQVGGDVLLDIQGTRKQATVVDLPIFSQNNEKVQA